MFLAGGFDNIEEQGAAATARKPAVKARVAAGVGAAAAAAASVIAGNSNSNRSSSSSSSSCCSALEDPSRQELNAARGMDRVFVVDLSETASVFPWDTPPPSEGVRPPGSDGCGALTLCLEGGLPEEALKGAPILRGPSQEAGPLLHPMRFKPSFPLPGLLLNCLRGPGGPSLCHHSMGLRGQLLSGVRARGGAPTGLGIPLNPYTRISSSSNSNRLCRRSLSSSNRLVAFGELRDRWFVAYKPPGWSVGPQPGAPSLSEYLEDALIRLSLSEAAAAADAARFAAKASKAAAAAAAATATIERASFRKLCFPQQALPLEAQGLLFVATDEGACKAIRRLIASGQVEERYHVLAEIPQGATGGLGGAPRGPSYPRVPSTTEKGGPLQVQQHKEQQQQEGWEQEWSIHPSSTPLDAPVCERGPSYTSPVGGSDIVGAPLGPLEAADREGGLLPEGILCSERQRRPVRAPEGGAPPQEVCHIPLEGGPQAASDSPTSGSSRVDVGLTGDAALPGGAPAREGPPEGPPKGPPTRLKIGKWRLLSLRQCFLEGRAKPTLCGLYEVSSGTGAPLSPQQIRHQFAAAGFPLLNDQHNSNNRNNSNSNNNSSNNNSSDSSSTSNNSSSNSSSSDSSSSSGSSNSNSSSNSISSSCDLISCSDRNTTGTTEHRSSESSTPFPEDPYGFDAGGPLEEEGGPPDEQGGPPGPVPFDSPLEAPEPLRSLFSISHAEGPLPQQQRCPQQQAAPLAAAAVPFFDIPSSSSSSSSSSTGKSQPLFCVSLGLQRAALAFPDPLSPRTGTQIRVSVDLPPDWTAAS
ncbi:hypothetical protein Emag_005193 [Eimeria magna]